MDFIDHFLEFQQLQAFQDGRYPLPVTLKFRHFKYGYPYVLESVLFQRLIHFAKVTCLLFLRVLPLRHKLTK